MEPVVKYGDAAKNAGYQLYAVNQQLQSYIEEAVDTETGEISELDSLIIEEIFKDKVQAISHVVNFIKNTEAFSSAIDVEMLKLKMKKKLADTMVDKAKEYLSHNVEIGEKIETASYKISWRKSSSIEIDEAIATPNEVRKLYPDAVKVEMIQKISKTELGKLLKAGNPLPKGCRLVEKQNIQIK